MQGASSEWTEAFLRDGGVARAEPVLSGLRSSSAMAVWPGNPRESVGAGPDCADCSSRAEKLIISSSHHLIIHVKNQKNRGQKIGRISSRNFFCLSESRQNKFQELLLPFRISSRNFGSE